MAKAKTKERTPEETAALEQTYADLLAQKIAAGLPKEQAQEVVAAQRAHDEAVG